jgi:hypothetical protein
MLCRCVLYVLVVSYLVKNQSYSILATKNLKYYSEIMKLRTQSPPAVCHLGLPGSIFS